MPMHVVIMGCGRVGSLLAIELEANGHSVAVIDQSKEAFRRLGPDFKGRTVTGVGFDRDTLLEAGIEGADAFAAVSNGDNSNILVVHSLSKRSSMAGYRGAFLIGDAKLIAQIREVRKHAGMMVPLPIQNAMVAALSDEKHVQEQRERYNARRAVLAPALQEAGFQIDDSAAGLYLWCTRSEDAWKSVEWLANLGILATPGVFYGPKGASHIRVAMTATDSQIADAAARIRQVLK